MCHIYKNPVETEVVLIARIHNLKVRLNLISFNLSSCILILPFSEIRRTLYGIQQDAVWLNSAKGRPYS